MLKGLFARYQRALQDTVSTLLTAPLYAGPRDVDDFIAAAQAHTPQLQDIIDKILEAQHRARMAERERNAFEGWLMYVRSAGIGMDRIVRGDLDRHYEHIDAPGHAAYVRNMITGHPDPMLYPMFVSAADGPMPRTPAEMVDLVMSYDEPHGADAFDTVLMDTFIGLRDQVTTLETDARLRAVARKDRPVWRQRHDRGLKGRNARFARPFPKV